MEKFARIVVGYHGCPQRFAKELLLATMPISNWQESQNAYDWLGKGIYVLGAFAEPSSSMGDRALSQASRSGRRHNSARGVL
jgi:hypothetical protein